MEYIIHGRKPESVFRYFEEISAIPRGSYNEAGIADYLCAFAAARGLEHTRDRQNNVLIKAPASPDRPGAAPLLLQGHTDMVCEKNRDTVHDFLHDPLKLWIDGKYLRARGTTLGGDDGIAVAMMLALLDGELPSHPAYECLFTTAEEVGMDGAHAFDYSLLSARRMLNLDSEEFGVVTAGCAGGVRSDLTLDATPEALAGDCIEVRLTGLAGGHSGENINCGRANANKLLGRLLAALSEAQPAARLVSLAGGSKDNAIPREAVAVLAVPDADGAVTLLTDIGEAIAAELCEADRGFRLSVSPTDTPCEMLSAATTRGAITVLACAANGVLEMSRKVAGLVEFSRNLGVIRQEDGKLTFVFSSRSSIEEQLNASQRDLDLLASAVGGKVRHHSRYPGWSYAEKSAIRDAYLSAFREVTGTDARVNVIHAGLECSVIHDHVPDMDMISIGPDMKDIHSPDEALDLSSVEHFWSVLAHVIKGL